MRIAFGVMTVITVMLAAITSSFALGLVPFLKFYNAYYARFYSGYFATLYHEGYFSKRVDSVLQCGYRSVLW